MFVSVVRLARSDTLVGVDVELATATSFSPLEPATLVVHCIATRTTVSSVCSCTVHQKQKLFNVR